MPFDLGVDSRSAAGRLNTSLIDRQMDRRLVVRGRHQDAPRRRDFEAEHGRRIEVGEEDQASYC